MSTRRTITITLTEPQFRALGMAVDRGREELQSDIETDTPGRALIESRVLDTAWHRIASAWNAKAR